MEFLTIDIGGSGVKIANFSFSNRKLLLKNEPAHYSNPDWSNFEKWLIEINGCNSSTIGISSAGFVDSKNGVVKMFRVGGWIDRNIKNEIERLLPNAKVFILNDAEAHLAAHTDTYDNSQLCITLGTSLGFAISDSLGNVYRPPDNINFDLGEIELPTRASNRHVWWSLGSHGLQELQQNLGEHDGVIHFGYRLGAFLKNICSIFRPQSVVFCGGIAEKYWNDIRHPIINEFAHSKPDWLTTPQFYISQYGKNSALWGMAKHLSKQY
ncbi:MAG: ROK family protein [Desulfuromonadaceae bacterium]|nr:ROK family protein [Desulfuromonadaceae bacterium]